MIIYRVKNWGDTFETYETKRLKQMCWVAVPNRHDTEGFRTVIEAPNGIVMYGIWHLILQVASKCPKRGTLAKADGEPMTASAIAKRTGFRDVKEIERTLKFLSSAEVGWLEVVAQPIRKHSPAPYTETPADCAGVSAESPTVAADCAGRMEGNGMEEREREGAGAGGEVPEAGPDEAHGILRRQPELRGLTWEQDLVARKAVAGNPKIGSKFSPWFSEAAARIADMAVLAGEIDHVGSWLRAQYAKLAAELDGPRVPAAAGGFQKNKPAAGPAFDPAARCFTSHADQED